MGATETVRGLVHKVGGLEALDTVAKPVASKVSDVVGHGALKDALSGTWLGHPLHPLLTDVPIGFWTSSFMLDLVGGRGGRKASKRLLGLGILSALPTAAAGLSDWSDTLGEERRIGTAHAIGNTAALVLYTLSWRARGKGSWSKGVALGFLGAGAATVGGYLGGHLIAIMGVGVDRHAWNEDVTDWIDVGDQVDFLDGQRRVVKVGDDDVLLVRDGLEMTAISNVCGHAGGPLDEGEFDGEGCVTCPWHASVFRLSDGGVVHGPATNPQPAYDVRAERGMLSVRRRRSPA
ncbi:MAG: Rieske 2Fe-2S domain-containing protein [Actinomycetota bacterium]|nr:Rieske 2Fe-2S domain-containing protein [Actinomycetota bacterium]